MEIQNVHQAKTNFSRLLERVRRGEEIVIVTSHGKPVAILSATDEHSLERALGDIRRSRARAALAEIHREAARRGLDRLSMEEIDAEIKAARSRRRAR